ncbi:hypothetical protein [Streptomyces platensis]
MSEIVGLDKLRYAVEQTVVHQFKRLAVRWQRRLDLHDAIVSLPDLLETAQQPFTMIALRAFCGCLRVSLILRGPGT